MYATVWYSADQQHEDAPHVLFSCLFRWITVRNIPYRDAFILPVNPLSQHYAGVTDTSSLWCLGLLPRTETPVGEQREAGCDERKTVETMLSTTQWEVWSR